MVFSLNKASSICSQIPSPIHPMILCPFLQISARSFYSSQGFSFNHVILKNKGLYSALMELFFFYLSADIKHHQDTG